jgi:hypothetical protein
MTFVTLLLLLRVAFLCLFPIHEEYSTIQTARQGHIIPYTSLASILSSMLRTLPAVRFLLKPRNDSADDHRRCYIPLSIATHPYTRHRRPHSTRVPEAL